MRWNLAAATLADVDTLLPYVRAYHEFEGVELSESRRRAGVTRLTEDATFGGVWFVQADHAIAGYIALCVGFSLEFGGYDAFVDEFYLAPEYRGLGGGKMALAAIKELARERNIQKLHLEVARDNARARALYGASGFVAREKYVLMSVDL